MKIVIDIPIEIRKSIMDGVYCGISDRRLYEAIRNGVSLPEGKGKYVPERYNKLIFSTVECSAYLKKVKDGKYIYKVEKGCSGTGRDEWFYSDEHNKDEKARARIIPDEDIGGSDFIKTYYELTEKQFTGVVVGFEIVTVKAELYLDYYQDDYSERYFVNKHPMSQWKCARVFYGCNRSRLVPLDKIVERNEREGHS